MSKIKFFVVAFAVVALGITIGIEWETSDSRTRNFWQQAVAPGALSQSHASLSNNCVACHTQVKGVEAGKCIACHADNSVLLQRQPTAFHANIQTCTGCHVEHQGTVRMPTTMDHALLAQVGHKQLKAASEEGLSLEDIEVAVKLLDRTPRSVTQKPLANTRSSDTQMSDDSNMSAETKIAVEPPSAPKLPVNHPGLSANESMLNCVSCHATKDRHQGLLGKNCVQCHATTQWTVSEFRHPSSRSTNCAQCHLAPPSHNMMHFSMMSAPIARQPNAKVNQCYLCHQTTSWNDIKGVGLIKHH
ncbi:cytochrome c3 family protein [Methylotenera mobilis]|jgi:hypothetical protein|uniref:cytochrome c3 family protein n=1 Tax=Methylotenera mobilis TaxID=359408 RepID=UPI000363A23E|nr:cytochrome c3 family protein [Methylotenera mobilis]MDP3008186.1 cytochrome c3 family protein [Methylococcales bacterium]PPC93273.1 MAG: hypothetical protein CTY33_08655 [Methylotenera sp.]